jgi:ADP-ribosylglycohydrolase
MSSEITIEKFQGCVVGLAVGDALGYPHEFRRVKQVRAEIAPEGITDFLSVQDPRFSRPLIIGKKHPPGTYTDDTQMTLAVAEALIEAGDADLDALMTAMGRHFVAWADSPDNNRSPGATCMTGCANLKAGIPWDKAGVANSKGCGSAMRVAPIGLYYDDVDRMLEVARASSVLTHGHDAAVEGAAAAALSVFLALRGKGGPEIHDTIVQRCFGRSADFDACLKKLPASIGQAPDQVLVEGGLGESWVAEEAAASALYCFWRHPDEYRATVLEGANTEGDSDSIACIAGGISGARLGLSAIDAHWRQGVEDSEGLIDLANRLFRASHRGNQGANG